MAEIGIKLADGSFFPILDDTSATRKRVVLTTAQDDQHNVQVDLIRKDGEIVEHVGCLLLEELADGDASALEFALVIGIDDQGNVDAQISTEDGSQYQSLAVNVYKLQGSTPFDLPDVDSDLDLAGDLSDIEIPDFELDSDDIDASGFEDSVGSESYTSEFAESYSDNDFDEPFDEEPRRFNLLAVVAVVLIALSLIALATFGIFQLLSTEALPELRATAVLPVILRRRLRTHR